MSLEEKRRQVRSLLMERSAADASAAYYALYHPDDKTEIAIHTDASGVAQGYVCLSRTGMDLFRPLLTLRLPTSAAGKGIEPKQAAMLIYEAMSPGTELIINAPEAYRPIITALFDIQSELRLRLMMLHRAQFEPTINVLVTESESYNGLPRYEIRSKAIPGSTSDYELAASAGLNWQSPHFAEIYVHTRPSYRRRGFGRSVVAAVVQKVLAEGKTPLYAVGLDNEASAQLAESVGFADTGLVDILYEATLSPRPL
jgi:RimJ/RimL family protein N-acetyltransferase